MAEQEFDSEFMQHLDGLMAKFANSNLATVTVIDLNQTYPGFSFEGLLPAYRKAAAPYNLHIADITVMEGNSPKIYVLASKKIELTNEDIASVIPGYISV